MKVAYEVAGTGDPLLLVSGLGQTGKRWRRVTPLLENEFTVVTFDNRETGGTGPSAAEFTLTAVAEDALALMTDLGHERFFLAGISMGGMIAQEIVRIAGRDRVRAAVLFSTWGGASIAVRDDEVSLLFSSPGDDRPVWAKLAGPGFWEAHPDVIDEETQLSIEQATPPLAYMRQMQAIAAWDPDEDAVRSTHVPIVVAHGERDPFVLYENGVLLAKRLGVELVTYEGAGHVLECERPAEMADLMRSHFATADRASGLPPPAPKVRFPSVTAPGGHLGDG
ncbi:MAG TPA: alpha/beta hydrolase [Acidimicrobiales bacterium]